MTELLPSKPEQHLLPKFEEVELLTASTQAEHLQESKVAEQQKLEKARATVEQAEYQENPLDNFKATEKAQEMPQPTYINQELKSITLGRELKQLRRKLPAPERALSKIVHQPVVRAVSEATGKSVSRPSGLLGGGLVAFIGTAAYYYLAKNIGFSYNYFVFILLFIGGFMLGLFLEVIVWFIVVHKHQQDR